MIREMNGRSFLHVVQFEDVLLFIWLILVTPLLQILLGDALRG